MMFIKRSLLVIACLGLFGSAANAGVLYDNVNSPILYPDPLALDGPQADSFSTGAAGFTLADVTLNIFGGPSPGSFTIQLLSDNSTSPGTVLDVIGTFSDNIFTSKAPYDFPLATPYTLAADTRYWLQVLTTNGSTAEWGVSLDQSALGVAGEYYANSAGVFPNIDGPYQMRLSSSAVPEPASLTLALSGIIGLLLLRLRLRLSTGLTLAAEVRKQGGPTSNESAQGSTVVNSWAGDNS